MISTNTWVYVLGFSIIWLVFSLKSLRGQVSGNSTCVTYRELRCFLTRSSTLWSSERWPRLPLQELVEAVFVFLILNNKYACFFRIAKHVTQKRLKRVNEISTSYLENCLLDAPKNYSSILFVRVCRVQGGITKQSLTF